MLYSNGCGEWVDGRLRAGSCQTKEEMREQGKKSGNTRGNQVYILVDLLDIFGRFSVWEPKKSRTQNVLHSL